jgi:hypothetical protein
MFMRQRHSYKHSSLLLMLCLFLGACFSEPVNNKKIAGRKLAVPTNTLSAVTIFEDTPTLVRLSYDDGGYRSAKTCDVQAATNVRLSACTCSAGECSATVSPLTLNSFGSGNFRYTVTSDLGQSVQTSVVVTIASVNDAPVATEEFNCTGTSRINEEGVCNGFIDARDTDVASGGDSLSFSVTTNGTNGTFLITNPATGAYRYTPLANVPRGTRNAVSSDCIPSPSPNCSPLNGCQGVAPTNNVHRLSSGSYGVFRGSTSCFATKDGGVTWTNLGLIGAVATDFAIVKVSDRSGAFSSVRVSVEVAGVNDAPTANTFDLGTVLELGQPNISHEFSLLSLFSDVENDSLSYFIIGGSLCRGFGNPVPSCVCSSSPGIATVNALSVSSSACNGDSGYYSYTHADNEGIFLLNTASAELSWIPNEYGANGVSTLTVRVQDSGGAFSSNKLLTLTVTPAPNAPKITMPATPSLLNGGTHFLDGANPYIDTIIGEGAIIDEIDNDGVIYKVDSVTNASATNISSEVRVEFTNDANGTFKITFVDPEYYGADLKFNFKVCNRSSQNLCTDVKTFEFTIDFEDDAPRVADGFISFTEVDDKDDVETVIDSQVGYVNILASSSLYTNTIFGNAGRYMTDDDTTFDNTGATIKDKFEFLLVSAGASSCTVGADLGACDCAAGTSSVYAGFGCPTVAGENYYVHTDTALDRKVYLNKHNGNISIRPLKDHLISMAGIQMQVNERNVITGLTPTTDDLLSQVFDIDFNIIPINTAPVIRATAGANRLIANGKNLLEGQSTPYTGNWLNELNVVDYDREGLKFFVTSGAINELGIVTIVDNETGDYRFTLLDSDVNSFINDLGSEPNGIVSYFVKACKKNNTSICSDTEEVLVQAMDYNDKPTATLATNNVYSLNQGGIFYITLQIKEGGSTDEYMQTFGNIATDWSFTSSNSALVDSSDDLDSPQVSIHSFTDNGTAANATLVLKVTPKSGAEGTTQLNLKFWDDGVSQIADTSDTTFLSLNPDGNPLTYDIELASTAGLTAPIGAVVICPSASPRSGCEIFHYTSIVGNTLVSTVDTLTNVYAAGALAYKAVVDKKFNNITFNLEVKGSAEFTGYSDVVAYGAKVDADKEILGLPSVGISWNPITVIVNGVLRTSELKWKVYREDITDLYMEKALEFKTNPPGGIAAGVLVLNVSDTTGYATPGIAYICPDESYVNCESFYYDTKTAGTLECNLGAPCSPTVGTYTATADIYHAPNNFSRVAISEAEYEEVFANSVAVNTATLAYNNRSYLDTNVRIGRVYAYLVKAEYTDPSTNKKTLIESYNESFRFIDVPIPPDNMALVHRSIANLEMCFSMGRSITGNTIDPENFNRCDYKGPGAILTGGNYYYDVLRHHFVDIYEAGCPFSYAENEVAGECSSDGCISKETNAPTAAITYDEFYRLDKLHVNTSAYKIDHGDVGVFYNRESGKCSYTIDQGSTWHKFDSSDADFTTLMANTELSFNSPKLPPLTHISQTDADIMCKLQEPKCSTYAFIKRGNIYYTAKQLGAAGELVSLKILDNDTLGDTATVSVSGNLVTLTIDVGETKAQTIIAKINGDSSAKEKIHAVIDDPTNVELVQSTTQLVAAPFTGLSQLNRYSCSDSTRNPYGLWARSSINRFKELPSRKLQVAASAWSSSLTSAQIVTRESGLALNTNKGCNTSNGNGLTFSNQLPANDTTPGTNSSNIRALKTGSSMTSNCISRYGIQDLIGNVREWTQEEITGCASGGLDYSTYAIYTTTDGANNGIIIQYKNPNGTFGSDGDNLVIEVSNSSSLAEVNFSGIINGGYNLDIFIKDGVTTHLDVVNAINNDPIAKNTIEASLANGLFAATVITTSGIGNDPTDKVDTFTSATETDPTLNAPTDFAYSPGTNSECTVSGALNSTLFGLEDLSLRAVLNLSTPSAPAFLTAAADTYDFDRSIENNYPSNTPINYGAWLFKDAFEDTTYVYLPVGMPVYDTDSIVDNDGDNKEDAHEIISGADEDDVSPSDENVFRGDQIDLHLNSRESLSQETCPCVGAFCTGNLPPIEKGVVPGATGVYYFNTLQKTCYLSTGPALGNWVQVNHYGENRAMATGGAYTGAYNSSTRNQGDTGNKAGRFTLDLINRDWSHEDDPLNTARTNNKYTGFRCSIGF